jgi:hypothetical protein
MKSAQHHPIHPSWGVLHPEHPNHKKEEDNPMYRDDTSPYVSSPYDTSLHIISQRFYISMFFIPEER